MEELLFCELHYSLLLRGEELERAATATFNTFGIRDWLDEMMPTRWELKLVPGFFDLPHPFQIGLRPVGVYIVFDTAEDRMLFKLRWDV